MIAALRSLRSTGARSLPARYAEPWLDAFYERIRPSLHPGVTILDVGSGRRPSIPTAKRPAGCRYVGLDLFLSELEKAPAGSYDEMYVADVAQRLAELEGRFDLVVSWQVLEHVKPLDVAIDNLRAYLRPGGRLVAQMSGAYSLFGIVNRLVPQRLGVWAMQRLLGRNPETVFPAYYDRCTYTGLMYALRHWRQFDILPRYNAGYYLRFWGPVYSTYLRYENWTYDRKHWNLATHYLVTAAK
ncbi:MAG: class I SAM-dependent methyltransferase [Dehalococcoidia bacterium]